MGIILGNFHTAFPVITSTLNTVTSKTTCQDLDWLIGLWPLTTIPLLLWL